MSYQIVGTCSICGGPVGVPMAWWGVLPPTPTCTSCGATKQGGHGPIIPMEPRRPFDDTEFTYKAAVGDAHG